MSEAREEAIYLKRLIADGAVAIAAIAWEKRGRFASWAGIFIPGVTSFAAAV